VNFEKDWRNVSEPKVRILFTTKMSTHTCTTVERYYNEHNRIHRVYRIVVLRYREQRITLYLNSWESGGDVRYSRMVVKVVFVIGVYCSPVHYSGIVLYLCMRKLQHLCIEPKPLHQPVEFIQCTNSGFWICVNWKKIHKKLSSKLGQIPQSWASGCIGPKITKLPRTKTPVC